MPQCACKNVTTTVRSGDCCTRLQSHGTKINNNSVKL